MMRATLAILAAALAGPALAQSAPPPPDSAPRLKYVEIIRGEACPKSTNADEIIVCRTLEPENQFRLPSVIRQEQEIARRDDVSGARAALVDSNIGNTGSCSASGSAGQFGCTQGLSILGAARAAVNAVRGEDTVPDEVPQ